MWTYRTTFRSHICLEPFLMVYKKSCHLPVELEHKASWALEFLNFDLSVKEESTATQVGIKKSSI